MVRAKAQLMAVLVVQLEPLRDAVESYSERVESFFASMPAAKLVKRLPGGKTGTIVADACGLSWVMPRVAGNPFVTFKPKRE